MHTTMVRIGLPLKLLLAIRSNIGAVRRTTFDAFRKTTNSGPGYVQVAFYRSSLQCCRSIFQPEPKVIRSSVNGAIAIEF